MCPWLLTAGCLFRGTREEVEKHQKECPHLEPAEKSSLQDLIKEACMHSLVAGSWTVSGGFNFELSCVLLSLLQLQSVKQCNNLLQKKLDHLMSEKTRMEAKMEKDSL